MATLVGCCGTAGLSLAEYARRFPVLELQSTFYKLPMRSTAERWRTTAPCIAFTLKAFQGVTHPADSPTWRRAGRELEGIDPSDVGLLRPSNFVRKAWAKTIETAGILDAKVVVVQLPPSFDYSQKNLLKLKRFFSSAESEFIPAVEFRHKSWLRRLEAARRALERCGGVVVTNPLKMKPLAQPIQYHRLHGSDGFVNYRHRYSDQELKRLARKVGRVETFVLFNNLSMREDAEKFHTMLKVMRAEESVECAELDGGRGYHGSYAHFFKGAFNSSSNHFDNKYRNTAPSWRIV